MIYRYNSKIVINTRNNPLEDLCLWTSSLRSISYSEDLLFMHHGFKNKRERKICAQQISAYAEHAINLLHQAFSGPNLISYLPIYYSMLNLAKICIIVKGERQALERQRWHGASYVQKSNYSIDLLNEQISLKSKGAIPLLYKVITGSEFPRPGTIITLKRLYPYIHDVSVEYSYLYGEPDNIIGIQLEIEGEQKSGYYIKCTLNNASKKSLPSKSKIKLLSGFTVDLKNPKIFYSKKIRDTEENAKNKLYLIFRRYLIQSTVLSLGQISTYTPVSSSQFQLFEEFPLILVFFHLSNVVRYNPLYLERLYNSKACTLLLTLPKQGAITFLELFWSLLRNEDISILHT